MLKATLAILSFIMSGYALAGDMGSCNPASVTAPCEARGWLFGAQALYLRPTYTVDEGYEYTSSGVFNEVDKWGWGYRIEGAYQFNNGNDLTMNWSHYDIDGNHPGFAGLTPYSGAAAMPFNLFLDNKFNQVNLVLGQHVDMGTMEKMRFYGGFQYAKIQVDKTNNYLLVPPAIAFVATSLSQFRNSDYNGVGPVLGVDYSYNLSGGIRLLANTAGSILYGTSRYNAGFVFAPTGLVQTAVYASKKSVIPSLEAKLGLNYAYGFAQGMLNLDAGYQVINYFHALETRGPMSFAVGQNSNFGLFGPYFGVNWIGSI